jgi:hypothetical protein
MLPFAREPGLMPGPLTIKGTRGLFRVRGWQRISVGMIDGTVLGEQLWLAITGVMRVGKSEIDQKRAGVARKLALVEVVENLLGMPCTSVGVVTTTFVGVFSDSELLVGAFIAVPDFAGAHRRITGTIEDGGHGVLLEIGRTVTFCARPDRQVPQTSPAHNHVSRRRADCANERPHVMRAIENHPLGGEPIKRRGVQGRRRLVDPEIKRRLIVDNDEENIGAKLLYGK